MKIYNFYVPHVGSLSIMNWENTDGKSVAPCLEIDQVITADRALGSALRNIPPSLLVVGCLIH